MANSATKDTLKPQLASQDVGLIFVREYYTFLNKKPHRLHAFYNKDSLFIRGDEGTVSTTIKGQEDIRKKIEECKFEDCKVLVTQVDSQVSANNGILIQVLGEMCNQNGPSQKFSQTFFLATQPNGYYVLNDIFRFLKDEVDIDYYTGEQEVVTSSTPVNNPAPSSTTNASDDNVVNNSTSDIVTEAAPATTEQQTPEVLKTEPKKVEVIKKIEQEEVSDKKEQAKKAKDEVKATNENNKRIEPTTGSDTPTKVKESPVVQNEEKKRKFEAKQQRAEQKQYHQQQQKASSTANAVSTTPTKPATPKTWANLTAATNTSAGTATNGVNNNTEKLSATTTDTPTTTDLSENNAPAESAPTTTAIEKPTNNTNHQSNKPQHNRKEATQIFVKLVTETVNDDQLIEAFTKFGPVKSCSISRGRNCAFIEFMTPEACQLALAQHKVQLNGGHTVLAEERRYNNQNNPNSNNRYNSQRNQNNGQPFEQRRSNNSRRQNNSQQQRQNSQGGKGRGSSQQQK